MAEAPQHRHRSQQQSEMRQDLLRWDHRDGAGEMGLGSEYNKEKWEVITKEQGGFWLKQLIKIPAKLERCSSDRRSPRVRAELRDF